MPPPAAARRRNQTRRRGRARKSPAFHVSVFNCMPEPWEAWERDWAELPADAISCVLHKLSLAELLLGGVAEVCRSWRRAAREEPELWRRIDVRCLPSVPAFTRRATLENLMRTALRLSAGQCRTFLAQNLDDDLFMIIAQRAPSLKTLHLRGCYGIMRSGGFANGIKKPPLLEELRRDSCYGDEQVLQHVAQVCRFLKRFELVQSRLCYLSYRIKRGDDDDQKALAIARMHGLRSLTLVGDNLGNKGLAAIIHNCPYLEYLYIRDCWNITMDDDLSAKCARINMSYHEYFPSSKPCRCCNSPTFWFSGFSDDDYDPDDYHDLSLYFYLGDEIDGLDIYVSKWLPHGIDICVHL